MPRDPEIRARHIQEVIESGITKQSPAKIIRQTCFDCAGKSWRAVKDCKDKTCLRWAYRFGFNPFSGKKNNNFLTNSMHNAHPVKKVQLKYVHLLKNDSESSLASTKQENASERIPVRRLPVVKIAILEWLIEKLRYCNEYFPYLECQFHGSDIERIPCPKFCTAETRRRRFRELNEDYNIVRCINPNKSLYEIIVTRDRLFEIWNILRRNDYGKHATGEAR